MRQSARISKLRGERQPLLPAERRLCGGRSGPRLLSSGTKSKMTSVMVQITSFSLLTDDDLLFFFSELHHRFADQLGCLFCYHLDVMTQTRRYRL